MRGTVKTGSMIMHIKGIAAVVYSGKTNESRTFGHLYIWTPVLWSAVHFNVYSFVV